MSKKFSFLVNRVLLTKKREDFADLGSKFFLSEIDYSFQESRPEFTEVVTLVKRPKRRDRERKKGNYLMYPFSLTACFGFEMFTAAKFAKFMQETNEWRTAKWFHVLVLLLYLFESSFHKRNLKLSFHLSYSYLGSFRSVTVQHVNMLHRIRLRKQYAL